MIPAVTKLTVYHNEDLVGVLHNHVFLPLQGVFQGLKHQCIVYEIFNQ